MQNFLESTVLEPETVTATTHLDGDSQIRYDHEPLLIANWTISLPRKTLGERLL